MAPKTSKPIRQKKAATADRGRPAKKAADAATSPGSRDTANRASSPSDVAVAVTQARDSRDTVAKSASPQGGAQASRGAAPAAPTDAVADTLKRLEALRAKLQAQLDGTTDQALRDTLNDGLDTIDDTETKLNQEAIAEHTLTLQAAENQLDAGIEALEKLRDDLDAVSSRIAEVASVLSTIDGVLSGLKAVLGTFA